MIRMVGKTSYPYHIALRIFWVLFALGYCICPVHTTFNPLMFRIILVVYLIAFFCFFKAKKKDNYFDFDTILLTFCTIEHFMGFLFVGTEDFDRLFVTGMDYTLITKGALLASVGLVSYMIGASKIERNESQLKERAKSYNRYKVISPEIIISVFFLSYVMFVLSGGLSFFESQYKDGVGSMAGNGRIFQAISLMTIFSNILCARFVLDYLRGGRISKRMLFFALIIFVVAAHMALVGNRTIFSYLILPYVISFFSYVKKLNATKTLVLMIIGVIGMYAIQIFRQGGDTYSTNSILRLFSDVIAPSRAYLGGFEYVNHYGYTYGVTMLHSFYSLIPGLATFIGESASIGSAEAITYYLADGTVTGGLGTTIIADVYISFGFVGVLVFMYYLGWFVHKTWTDPLNDMLIQMAMLSCCVFMGRSAYFSPLRLIVWSIVFCSIIISFIYGVRKKNNVFPR